VVNVQAEMTTPSRSIATWFRGAVVPNDEAARVLSLAWASGLSFRTTS